ncbi:MAG TPA: hypothetical protein VJ914_11475 [Pseudonocardiaceae bacterium]|nr:hypothetical protein [Pseudonocardiaceae bacterium]
MPTPSYPSAVNDPSYRPSGGTALTAAGLAIPGGIFSLIVGIGAISGVQAINNDVPGQVVTGIYLALIGGFLSAIALLVGAGLIFGGKPAGRWLVVLGCVVVVACLIVVSAMIGSKISEVMSSQYADSNAGAAATGTAIGVAFIYSIPAIATFILAIVPLSGRYLAFRSSGGRVITPVQNFGYQAPQQQMYGQQPGYQQQQGFPQANSGGFPQQGGFQQPPSGGFAQPGGTYPPSDPGGFPQQPPNNPPQQW